MLVSYAIASYLLVLLFLGLRSRKTSFGEFMLADKKLGYFTLTASIVATFYGATAVLGGAELSYYFGLGALWFMIPFYVGNILVLAVIKKIEKHDAKTLPDLLGKHYGNKTVLAASILLTILCLVPESIIASGKIMNLIIPYSPEAWMIAVTGIIVFYVLLGGMRSVAYSDVTQFVLMLVALIILLPFALSSTPDFISKTPPENLNPMSYFRMLPQDAIRWSILLIFLPITSAPLYQRFFSAVDEADKKKIMLASILVYFMVDMMLLASGMIASVNSEGLGLSEENADVSIIVLGQHILPEILGAIFVVGILATVMGNADAWIHSGASSLTYDVVRKIFNLREESLLLTSRVFVFMLGVLSLGLALYFRDVIESLTFLLTVWISGILIPTLAALSNVKISGNAALASIVFGGGSAVLWRIHPLTSVDPLFVGLFFSITATLVASIFNPANKKGIL